MPPRCEILYNEGIRRNALAVDIDKYMYSNANGVGVDVRCQ